MTTQRPCAPGDTILVKVGVFAPVIKRARVLKIHHPKERYIIYADDGREYFWGLTAFPLELEGLL